MIKKHCAPAAFDEKLGPWSDRCLYVGLDSTVHWPAPRLPYIDTAEPQSVVGHEGDN